MSGPQYDPKELLFASLLGMDVYHRDLPGGLNAIVDSLPQVDGVSPDINDTNRKDIGFFAKAYVKDGKTYIVYRGTDDGSLDFINNAGSILGSLLPGEPGAIAGSLKQLSETVFKEKHIKIALPDGKAGAAVANLHDLLAAAQTRAG